MAARDGQLSREVMLAHLQAGRSVLISPVYGKDSEGNYVEKEPGKHVAHHRDMPPVLDTVVDDPAKLAAYKVEAQKKADAANAELAAVEKAEADRKAKELPAAQPTPAAPPKGK